MNNYYLRFHIKAMLVTTLAASLQLQAALPAAPIGDFDLDGISGTTEDYAAYIRSFGIQFRTYGVTNDEVTGVGLPRREDGQIYMISDHCLAASGILNEPIAVQNLPGMHDRLAALASIPPQYLRDYGQMGGLIEVFEDYGRAAKTWRIETIGIGTYHGYIRIFHTSTGYSGKIAFDEPNGDLHWNDLHNLTFNATTGAIRFERWSSTGARFQTYQGIVDNELDSGNPATAWSRGHTISGGPGVPYGSFRQEGDPNVYRWKALFAYREGGTTASFGAGPEDGCVDTGQERGFIPRAVQINMGISPGNMVHEFGHVIDDFIIAPQRLSFGTNERDEVSRLFVPCAPGAVPACGTVGSGHIDDYSGGNAAEDFAEHWMYFIWDRLTLLNRAAADISFDGNRALADKVGFFRDYVALPDPAPAALDGGGLVNAPWHFASRRTIRYGNAVRPPADIVDSRVHRAVAVAAVPQPAGAARIRLAAVGSDRLPYFRDIDSATGKVLTGWTTLNSSPSLSPMAATYFPERNETLMFFTFAYPGAADPTPYLAYQRTGPRGALLGPVTPVVMSGAHVGTHREFGVVSSGSQLHVYYVDDAEHLYTIAINRDLTTSGPPVQLTGAVPGGMRDGISAAAYGGVTYLFTLNKGFHGFHRIVTPGGSTGAWTAEPTGAYFATTPTMTQGGWLYVRGLADGQVYRRQLTRTDWSLVPGL